MEIDQFQKIDEIPFDFIRKRVSVVVAKNQDHILITKGAPEEILKVCTRVLKGSLAEPFTPEWHTRAIGVYENTEQGRLQGPCSRFKRDCERKIDLFPG